MNAAIYLLASDDNESDQHRLKLLVERVKSEGRQYKIFLEIADKKGTQPLKKDLLGRIYKNEFDTIFISRMSDWSTSLPKLSSELNELDSKGIQFISYNENFDSFSLTGKLYLQFLLAVNQCEESFDSDALHKGKDKMKSVDEHFAAYKKAERKTTEENTIELNNNKESGLLKYTQMSGVNSIPGISTQTRKNSGINDDFDLVGLNEACTLTGYSRHTIYQLTSRKLIPHFKRPRGRRIFFSKRALQQWIMTGKT
jgi:excisionase family DNA binding protein